MDRDYSLMGRQGFFRTIVKSDAGTPLSFWEKCIILDTDNKDPLLRKEVTIKYYFPFEEKNNGWVIRVMRPEEVRIL
jgi:hypothetical protein